MKLRHGGDFGKSSGSIWRLLFVFSLMPWMRRYRLSSNEKKITEQAFLQELALKRVPRDIDRQEKSDRDKEVEMVDIQDEQKEEIENDTNTKDVTSTE
mmetsp:Transcript_57575/g.67212  ORF Transcript_57575/g.67212 Transcript_57575/m.67212 type:complete len:98 (-) Transcript_57575:414-707(-)